MKKETRTFRNHNLKKSKGRISFGCGAVIVLVSDIKQAIRISQDKKFLVKFNHIMGTINSTPTNPTLNEILNISTILRFNTLGVDMKDYEIMERLYNNCKGYITLSEFIRITSEQYQYISEA